jgi:hypothetical protein
MDEFAVVEIVELTIDSMVDSMVGLKVEYWVMEKVYSMFASKVVEMSDSMVELKVVEMVESMVDSKAVQTVDSMADWMADWRVVLLVA